MPAGFLRVFFASVSYSIDTSFVGVLNFHRIAKLRGVDKRQESYSSQCILTAAVADGWNHPGLSHPCLSWYTQPAFSNTCHINITRSRVFVKKRQNVNFILGVKGRDVKVSRPLLGLYLGLVKSRSRSYVSW